MTVQLNEDQRGWLAARVPEGGSDSDVVRDLIEDARRREVVDQWRVWDVREGALKGYLIGQDGVGMQWYWLYAAGEFHRRRPLSKLEPFSFELVGEQAAKALRFTRGA